MATILLGGASGFIGTHLARALRADGHQVVPLTRRAGPDVVRWDPEGGHLDGSALARVAPEIVINLAGEPIAQRWTRRAAAAIRDSRVRGTSTLARAVASLPRVPGLFIGASAIGYYGADRGDEVLDESSAPGADVLGRLGVEWEAATGAAAAAGARVVLLRTGIVLHHSGGMLGRVLLPFRLGLGGPLGRGRQWMSWIALHDWVQAVRFIVATPAMVGPVNLTGPEPVRNAEFTHALAHALHRPAVFPVPAIALRLAFGEMADATILANQRVVPKRLAGAGFEFRHPRVDGALAEAVRRSADPAGR